VPNVGASNLIRHIILDLKTQIDLNTLMVGNFNTPLSPTDRSSRQRYNKETLGFNGIIDQIDLTDVY
jgi:hypothetical protein